MKPLAANTLLQNRYLIVHLIGKGGMGEVYLAIDQRLGSAAALKRTFFSGDIMLGNAFEREARTLARLRHPVLPKVSDHFIENDQQYLIMEHIAGDDLAKRLEISQKPFPLEWVMFWADQLLDALKYLHAQDPPVIHRDIKPQNLKLTDENSVVLLDFGLSKSTLGETRSATTTGSVVGYTPHYAPMEQIRGMGTDARSDIYSLSATLYQLLTNVVPPDVLSRADTLLSGKPDPVAPLCKINQEIPETVSEVILKGMSVSQEQRFGDAREMQKALRAAHAQSQDLSINPNSVLMPQNQKQAAGISQAPFQTNVGASIPAENTPLKSFSAADFARNSSQFSQSPAQTHSPKRRSSGKFLTIALLSTTFILAASAGVSWFLLYNSKAAETFPAPTPEAVAAPTPAAIVETNSNQATNVNVSNDNSFSSNADSQNSNANAQTENLTSESKTQNSNGKAVKAPPTPAVVKNIQKRTPPRIKATPKPTPPSKATPLPRILP